MTSDKAYSVEARLDALLGAQTDWVNFGTMTNSWAKSSGSAKYRMAIGGTVQVQMTNLTVGTTTNGTTIFSVAQGLPAGFRPGDVLWIPVRTDDEGAQSAAFMFGVDGHIECWGIGPAATRADCNIEFFAEN